MSIYAKGRRKEYKIRSDLLNEGWDIVQRTAGSHGEFDIVAVHKATKKIKFLQSKRTLKEVIDFTDTRLKDKIELEMAWLNGKFDVEFEVV